jgi:hypothetical protein
MQHRRNERPTRREPRIAVPPGTMARKQEAPMDDPLKKPDEPGAYVGREPERMAETIPGGVQPDDERIAAHSTQREEDPETADPAAASPEGAGRAVRRDTSTGTS